MRALTRIALGVVFALGFAASAAQAAGEADHPKDGHWHHGGPFGTYDRAALQRGFQVYKEVCSSCHSLRFIAFRNLLDIGLSKEEAEAIAAEYQVQDGPNDDGDMFERPAKLSDYMPSPFANEKAARASNNGAYPPDLSLIVKAREGHENYVYSILTGYHEAPAGVTVREGMSYNPYFPGHQIGMPQPLNPDQVEYADGTSASVDQMAHDVTTFLAWAGDPHMEARKSLGVKVIIFLVLFTLLMYAVKRKIWADVH